MSYKVHFNTDKGFQNCNKGYALMYTQIGIAKSFLIENFSMASLYR